MKFKLLEIFDNIYPFKRVVDTPTHIEYHFLIQDGIKYSVNFSEIKKQASEVSNNIDQETLIGVEMDFGMDDNTGQKDHITNTGDSIAVFSTILSILKEYIKELEPELFIFRASTDEPSRVKLYNRLARLFLKQFSMYHASKATTGNYIFVHRDIITSS